MRRAFTTTMTLSLALHGAVVGVVVASGRTRIPPPPSAHEHEEAEPIIAGDTFELPAPALGDPSSDPAPEPADEPTPDAPSEPSRRTAEVPSPSRSHRASKPAPAPRDGAETDDDRGEGTRYGAVGERSATDLATTFARAFTQTASEDPEWQKAPIGPAGEAVVKLTIDASGRIVDVAVEGTPSAALRSSIRRTMPLVKERLFTARQKTTRIHLIASVSTGEGDDGLESGRYGIAVHGGRASFVLPIGRRIQLRVR